jgi:CheY-like chemotaxis protein/HPt (histidine-containing phosphotransfer) domain-containing protein
MNKAEGGSTFCILMVDDDPMIRSLGKAILERSGCQVEVSGSGREAVEAFARKRYNMIFMDCSMPGMDGYEATGVIREMENKNRGKCGASRVPIVAMTGYSTEEDKRQCLQAGMDDYLSKPFTIAHMQTVLDRWLFTRPVENQEDNGEQDPSRMEARKEPVKGPDGQGETPPIDRNALETIASLQPSGSENILKKVISLYLYTTPVLMKRVHDAVEGTDSDALRQAAHTLKSSSAHLGALVFSEMCKDLERMGRDRTLEGAKDRVSALEHEYERVRDALEKHCASLS